MRSLVLGASGGIGSAIVAALEAGGDTCVALSRRTDGLDVTDESALQRIAGSFEGPFDLIFDTTGALEVDGYAPEKTIDALSPEGMAAQFAVNAIGPALLLKHFHPLLAKSGSAVFATLSARVGSIGDNRLGGWISYRAAKAALNQIVRTASIEISRKRPDSIVVALHPGTVATELTARYAGRHPTVAPDESAANLLEVIAGLRPLDSGGFFAWDGATIQW